ncbi:DUF4440 domain-containing protein [Sphingomonas gellani]|nr:DUF4440 domain-containing protein [Sphingomonas gellani]
MSWVLLACGALLAAPASAAWKTDNPQVAVAVKDRRIADALATVGRIDRAALADDHAAFAALLADDLAVSNPHNGVSVRGATAQRDAADRISYARYEPTIDYAGLRGDMVILISEEIVQPKEGDAAGDHDVPLLVHRRFTDLWMSVGNGN